MIDIGNVNYLAVLVAAGINMALGAFWYSPSGFGKQWMALMGLTDASMAAAKQKGMNKLYAAAFVASLVMAYVLAHIIYAFDALTLAEGAQGGFWVWLGFIATSMLGIILWEDKPPKLYVINAGYYLVSLIVMGAILAVWR